MHDNGGKVFYGGAGCVTFILIVPDHFGDNILCDTVVVSNKLVCVKIIYVGKIEKRLKHE